MTSKKEIRPIWSGTPEAFLEATGYMAVAQDEDGEIYAYKSRPTRGYCCWGGRGFYNLRPLASIDWSDYPDDWRELICVREEPDEEPTEDDIEDMVEVRGGPDESWDPRELLTISPEGWWCIDPECKSMALLWRCARRIKKNKRGK